MTQNEISLLVVQPKIRTTLVNKKSIKISTCCSFRNFQKVSDLKTLSVSQYGHRVALQAKVMNYCKKAFLVLCVTRQNQIHRLEASQGILGPEWVWAAVY